MNRVVDFLNSKWLIAIVVGLFLLGVARSFSRR